MEINAANNGTPKFQVTGKVKIIVPTDIFPESARAQHPEIYIYKIADCTPAGEGGKEFTKLESPAFLLLVLLVHYMHGAI